MEMQHYDRKDFELFRAKIRKTLIKNDLIEFDAKASRIRKEMRLIHAQCRVLALEKKTLNMGLFYAGQLRRSDFNMKDMLIGGRPILTNILKAKKK